MSLLCSNDVRETRLKNCKQCEYLSNKICTECGCLVAVKTWILNMTCPIGKWNK